jgi:hypothetical protein
MWHKARAQPSQGVAGRENLLELSTIIRRNWSTTVEEDDIYIRIYSNSKTIYCWLQCFRLRRFATIQEWD